MAWACGTYGWGEGVYRVLLGKTEGRRPLGRPRHRWVDNIRMDLQEVGCGYMDQIGLVQDRDRWRTLVSAVMNLGVPWNAGNFLTSCKPVSFSRRTLRHGVSKMDVNGQLLSPTALPRGNYPYCALGRRLARPHSRYGRLKKERHLLPLSEIEPPSRGRWARSLCAVLTFLSSPHRNIWISD